jgi:hypothetical protein
MHSLSSSRGKSAINWNGADNGLSIGLLQCDNVHFLPYEEIDCVGNGDSIIASFIRIPYQCTQAHRTSPIVGPSCALDNHPGKVDGEFRSLLKRNHHGSE